MQIQTLELPIGDIPGFTANCYIVAADEDSKNCIVIDPASRIARIESALAGRTVKAIVITHRHSDHVGALAALGEISNAPIYAHELEINGLAEEKASGSLSLGLHIEIPEKISVVKDGDILTLGDLSFTVLHTPGHTVGSICLYEESQGVLFSGDTLFCGAQGRTDLHSGSPRQMRESLSRLALLPDNTMVYPGHDQPTSIGRERHRALARI